MFRSWRSSTPRWFPPHGWFWSFELVIRIWRSTALVGHLNLSPDLTSKSWKVTRLWVYTSTIWPELVSQKWTSQPSNSVCVRGCFSLVFSSNRSLRVVTVVLKCLCTQLVGWFFIGSPVWSSEISTSANNLKIVIHYDIESKASFLLPSSSLSRLLALLSSSWIHLNALVTVILPMIV